MNLQRQEFEKMKRYQFSDRLSFAFQAGLPEKNLILFCCKCARYALTQIKFEDQDLARPMLEAVENFFLRDEPISSEMTRYVEKEFANTNDKWVSSEHYFVFNLLSSFISVLNESQTATTLTVGATPTVAMRCAQCAFNNLPVNADIEAFEAHVSWKHILVAKIATSILNVNSKKILEICRFEPLLTAGSTGTAKSNLFVMTAKPKTLIEKIKEELSLTKLMDVILALPESSLNALLQYAETILGCESLTENFDFLMTDYVSRSNCFTSLQPNDTLTMER